jgi:hypothetical protein
MTRILAATLLVTIAAAPAEAQDKKKKRKKDGKDDVVGTIWSFTARKGSETEKGRFRVYEKEVFKGSEKVGVVIPKDKDETTLVVTGFPKLNGKVVLRKVGHNPTVWSGDLLHENGSKWHIRVEVKDK